MIDNYPDARPQSGLHDADIVYEVEAEGGITRYLALYLSDAAAEVGPVRSARTYFVDLARPYDPLFAHAGQNDDTIDFLRELRNSGFADMDQIQRTPDAFWRDDSREMPHNLYVSVPKMRTTGPTYGYEDTRFAGRGFDFDEDRTIGAVRDPSPAQSAGANNDAAVSLAEAQTPAPAAIPAPLPFIPEAVLSFWQDYDVHYVWDGVAYQRFIDGQSQHDRDDNRPYEIADVIVTWIPATVLDAIGDLRMNVYGSYPALLIRQGCATTGTWSASGPAALPELVGENGAMLSLTRGQIYVEIMPQGSSVKIGNQTWSH